jgi:hypothetical protein
LRQFCRNAWHARFHDRELALGIGIVDPVIQAAAFQRVVDLAGAIRGDDDDRRLRRLDGAELGNCHLEVAENFQEIRLERLVGAVEFVDQQHRRAGDVRLQRLQQWTLDQKAFGEDIRRQLFAIGIAGGFRQPDRNHLCRAAPLVDGGGDVETFVALQANQLAPERGRQNLGDFGLADAGFPFEKQRAPHPQRQIGHRRQRPLGQVAARGEQFEHPIDGFG